MTAGTQTDPDFAFAGLATPEAPIPEAVEALAAGADPLGALAALAGTWKGHGFNAIWRPHHPANQQDRFLELNKTDETLVFTRINGPIPNRGLAMADIDMFGLTYMQQISESSTGAGLHIEPVLQDALQSSLQGTTMKSRTFLHVATDHTIINAGGGTANTAFLASSGNPARRQRQSHSGRGHILDRDDRGNRRAAGQAPAAVHAVGDARFQWHPLATRHGWHPRQAMTSLSRPAVATLCAVCPATTPEASTSPRVF